MIFWNFKVLFVAMFLTYSMNCLDLQRLSNNCLKGISFNETLKIDCLTPKRVKIQKITSGVQTFYCILYEKNSGDIEAFDVLALELHEDYDLKFTGSNVISNEATNPKFKLYDSRSKMTYKGKFAIGSDNLDFDIKRLQINGEDQVCSERTDQRKQVWPWTQAQPSNENSPAQILPILPPPTTEGSTFVENCGQIKRIEDIGGTFVLPSYPGQFPWMVAIYRYYDDEEATYYKCAGTIIDKRTILTSVNCLLEDGLLLEPSELQVYVTPLSLSAKRPKSKTFKISAVIPHHNYNYHLENNVAVLKLSRDIIFNDHLQPICLPNDKKIYRIAGKIGLFAGFGKSSARYPVKTELLTEAEYTIRETKPETFDAENTSGNNRISDIGGGLYINEANRWTLAGVMSKKSIPSAVDSMNKMFTFSSVAHHFEWIRRALTPEQQEI